MQIAALKAAARLARPRLFVRKRRGKMDHFVVRKRRRNCQHPHVYETSDL